MFFVKDADGYHYGDVKERIIIEVVDDFLNDKNIGAVTTDMIDLFNAVNAYLGIEK